MVVLAADSDSVLVDKTTCFLQVGIELLGYVFSSAAGANIC